MVHTYFVYGTKYHKFNNVKVEGVKPLPYGDFRHDFLQCHVTKTKTTETDKRVVDGDDVANNLPLIIGLVLTVCLIALAFIAYFAVQQRRQAALQSSKHEHHVTSSYSGGWQPYDGAGDKRIMCVTAAQQRWRLMRFQFQQQV